MTSQKKVDDYISYLRELYQVDNSTLLVLDEMFNGYIIPEFPLLDIGIVEIPSLVPPVFDMPEVNKDDFVLEKVELSSCVK